MSDDNKDDFSDVEEWLTDDDEEDLISSEEYSEDDESDHADENTHDESDEYEVDEEEEDESSERPEPGEYEHDEPDESGEPQQSGGMNKQSMIAIGVVGVTVVGLGFAGYSHFSGGSTPAPEPAPAFSAGGGSSTEEQPPEDDDFGNLLGEEVNSSNPDEMVQDEEQDFSANDSSEDPFGDAGSDIQFESFGGSTGVVEPSNTKPAPSSSESMSSNEGVNDAPAMDGRFEKTMEEYSKEADLVGSDDLDDAIESVRSYVDGRFETALAERKAIRATIEERKAKDRQQDIRVASLESEIKGLRSEISQAMASAERKMEAMASQQSTSRDSGTEVDASQIPDLSDRERLPGFKILATSNGGTMAITKTPTGKVQVFFDGEHLVVRGHGTMKVTGLRADGRVVLVGDKYFFDGTYKRPEPKPARQSKSSKSSPAPKQTEKPEPQERSKASNPASNKAEQESKPDYIIAEENPNDDKAEERSNGRMSYSESSAPMSTGQQASKSSSEGRKLAEGWKVVGNDANKSGFLVRSPAGRWHPVKVGQTIPEMGEVEGMDANKNLLVGEYIIISK